MQTVREQSPIRASKRARLNGVVVGTVNGEVHEHVCAWTENSWRWKTWKNSFMKYAYMLT